MSQSTAVGKTASGWNDESPAAAKLMTVTYSVNPTLTASNVTDTGATLTIANHSERLALQVHLADGRHLLGGGGCRHVHREPDRPDAGDDLHLQGLQRQRLRHGDRHRGGLHHAPP